MVLFYMKDTNTNTRNITTMTQQSSDRSNDQIDLEMKKTHQPKDKNLKEQQQQQQHDDVTEAEEESGREKLKRHRVEMGGRVWIPDIWGQEDFLKDWVDCTKFDPPFVSNAKIVTARTALVQHASNATGTAGFSFHYSC